MTLKIMNSVIHAPRRWEPKKRDRRPRSFGAFCSRIQTKTQMPKNAIIAMKSCRKPSTGQCADQRDRPGERVGAEASPISAPYASR